MPARKEIIVDGINIIETKNSYKIWSDNLQRYYYKSKDADYYNNWFHKTKGDRTCDICGKTVTCQLYAHKKSQKCQAKQKEMEVETLKRQIGEMEAHISQNGVIVIED